MKLFLKVGIKGSEKKESTIAIIKHQSYRKKEKLQNSGKNKTVKYNKLVEYNMKYNMNLGRHSRCETRIDFF